MNKAKRKFTAILTILLLLCGLTTTLSTKASENPKKTTFGEFLSYRTAPNFTLEDQFGNKTSVRFPSDKPVVLVFGDREGSEQVEGWVRPLYNRFANQIYIFGIAELSAVPRPIRPVVRRIIKSKSKFPVMLDWSGGVSKSYGCEKGKANVFIINKGGEVISIKRGAANQSSLGDVYQKLNSAL